MIQVFSQKHERLCLLANYKDYGITTELASGDQELNFSYPMNGPGAEYLTPENYIRTTEQEYVLKEVEGSAGWIKARAVLNLEDVQGKSFATFETVEQTAKDCINQALIGTGWKVGACEITKKRTIRQDSVCNALEVIKQCVKTYKGEVIFHTLTKTVDFLERVGADKGAYFMEAVNLRRPPKFIFKSTDFYTQIRPIGKDGLRIDHGGKDYLENHTYSPKNIMLTWQDERYTIAASLEEDAALKLAEMCAPVKTYEADVLDLAKARKKAADGADYSVLDYSIGDTITLVSKTSAVKEKMRIAKITEYPETPEKNTVELSNAKKTFEDMQEEVIAEAVQQATGAAAANTTERVETGSEITAEETRLLLSGMKTEILKDVSSGYIAKGETEAIEQAAGEIAAAAVKDYVDQQTRNFVTTAAVNTALTGLENSVTEALTSQRNENAAALEQERKDRAAAITAAQAETEKALTDALEAHKTDATAALDNERVERENAITAAQEAQEKALTDALDNERAEREQAITDALERAKELKAEDGTVWTLKITASGEIYAEAKEG